MGLLWGNNIFAKILVSWLMVYFYAEADSTTSYTEVSQDGGEDASAELYENSLQNNYQTGFVKMLEFFDNLSGNQSKMNERMSALETVVKDGQEELKKEIASVCGGKLQVPPDVTPTVHESNCNLKTEVTEGLADFTTENASAATATTESPLTTSTDCGGILGVVEGVPSTIRYPNGGNYRNYERCTWTLSPRIEFSSFKIKVQSFGMPGTSAGVMVYFINSTSADLVSQKIREFGSWISIPATYALITFCSYHRGVGAGFEASIVGVGISSLPTKFKPFWLTNQSDSFSYFQDTSSAGSNEIVSVVVQTPPNLKDVKVSVGVPQISNDTVKLYKLMCHHDDFPNHALGGRRRDESTSSVTYESSSNHYPFVIICKSSGRNSGEGFNISYRI